MDTPTPQTTSFMPKQPLAQSTARVTRGVSGLALFAWFIFVVSLLSAGGAFLMSKSTDQRIIRIKEQIASIRASFEEDTILDIKRLDNRIVSAQEILGLHVATSPIFEALQDRTLKSVSFDQFGYTLSEKSPGSRQIEVEMTGRATSYEAIAQQSDSLAENKYILNPIFSNMTLDEKLGTITFALSFNVNQTLVSFQDNLNRQSQGLGEGIQ